MMPDDNQEKDKTYYNIEDAWGEVKSDFSYGSNTEKAASTAKLVGKALFNTGVFAGKLGFQMIKELPHQLEKTQLRRKEMREKLEGKSDGELQNIIKSEGIFGAELEEKTIASSILRERSGK